MDHDEVSIVCIFFLSPPSWSAGKKNSPRPRPSLSPPPLARWRTRLAAPRPRCAPRAARRPSPSPSSRPLSQRTPRSHPRRTRRRRRRRPQRPCVCVGGGVLGAGAETLTLAFLPPAALSGQEDPRAAQEGRREAQGQEGGGCGARCRGRRRGGGRRRRRARGGRRRGGRALACRECVAQRGEREGRRLQPPLHALTCAPFRGRPRARRSKPRARSPSRPPRRLSRARARRRAWRAQW